LWQLQYAKAKNVGSFIKNSTTRLLSKRGTLQVDERTNTVYVSDIQTNLTKIKYLIKHLDVPMQQVAITARLASVDSEYEKELGLKFSTHHENNRDTSEYDIAVLKILNLYSLDIKLAALERAGRAQLISSPSLFTTNRKTAVIESGEEVPYQESTDSGGTAVSFKKATLKLEVTPQILPRDQVLLKLEINQDRPNRHLVMGMPSISTRRISTEVLVKNGQTVVLGGIYEKDNENAQVRLPFISQIPLVGLVFKQKKRRLAKRELLIFVTPKIIKPIR
jgi:type IV pilus assembly protein PilQ